MKKFAVFDIDGTLFRWQLYHELVQTLALADVFPHNAPRELDEHYNRWKGGELSFREYEQFVVKLMTENLPLVPIATFEAACDKVVEQSAHKTHLYPKALLKELKAQGYTIIAITGSQQELIERFGKRYDFDICVGAKYARNGNHFTGEKERSTVGHKPEILREIVETHHLSWEGSVAIGDSAGDASVLELVEQPIAFNPDSGLLERAKTEGWPVVIERKNIAYKLEKKGNELVLADTIVY
jgi:HAD superfamily phosphoserine phosphatase-like hydrolase